MSNVDEIQKYFTRFKFLDRITSCQYLSFCSIGAAEKYKRNALKPNWILEWNADTIIVLTLLIMSESKIIKELFSKDYYSYINSCLHTIDHLSFPKEWLDNIESLGGHAVFAPFFMQQKSYQEYIYSKLYRYYRIFNYDDKTRKFFANKTGVPDYLEFGYFASMPRVIKSSLNGLNDVDSFYRYQRLIELLLNKNTNVVNYLTISYKDFIKQTTDKCNTNNLEEVDFSYKVLHEKPIISIEGKNYLVCSHAFEYTCTDGLFSTVTFQEKIKDYLGKFALEDYLNDIAEESSLYLMVDKSKRRDRFKYKKNYNDPADLIFKKDSFIVLVESKECVHIRKTWINDKKSVEEEYRKCVEGVTKFVNLYRKFKQGFYNPFSDDTDKNKETFLVYLTLQYFPYFRKRIIEAVSENEDEKAYLNKYLFIIDYYSFEMYFLYKQDVIPVLKMFSDAENVEAFGTEKRNFIAKDRINSFKQFVNDVNAKAHRSLDEMVFELYGVHLNSLKSFGLDKKRIALPAPM